MTVSFVHHAKMAQFDWEVAEELDSSGDARQA